MSEEKAVSPQRVVSLLGAATEVLFRLGLGGRLVGRSHECDYPEAVLSLPCISRPRLDVKASSKEIDAVVRERSLAGEPIYKLDDKALSELGAIDLIIVQDHCRVCAITPSDIHQSETLACSNVRQLVLKPSTLNDCLDDVTTIASAMGVPERGVTLRATLQSRMDRVGTLASSAVVQGKKPRVALLEWCDPIMGCGYWLPELVEIAGGMALNCPPPGGATPTISFQTLLDSKPDVVVFALCGFGLKRAATEISSSWSNERLDQLSQACNGRLFVVDGNFLVNRSGPRIVESCEALAEAIHPTLLGHFGHFGSSFLSSLQQAIQLPDTPDHKVRPQAVEDAAQDDEATATILDDPRDAVAMQLKYLEQGNIESAYQMNSTANQHRWCGADRFAAVLRSHDDFRRLLEQPADVGTSEVKHGIATVHVSLPAKQEGLDPVGLLWTMVAEKFTLDDQTTSDTVAWRTEKVAMAH